MLPDKSINMSSPLKKSAAEMITSYFNISAEDMRVLAGLDPRVLLNLNIRLKYRAVIREEEERSNQLQR